MLNNTQHGLSSEQIQIESLKSQIKALQTRVAVTEDLENQVAMLKEQLAAMNYSKEQLELTLEAMQQQHMQTVKVLRAEADTLAQQLGDSHNKRELLHKELKQTSSYIGTLEGRILEAN